VRSGIVSTKSNRFIKLVQIRMIKFKIITTRRCEEEKLKRGTKEKKY